MAFVCLCGGVRGGCWNAVKLLVQTVKGCSIVILVPLTVWANKWTAFFFFLFFSFWDKRRMELKLLNNKSVITNKSGFYSSQQINHHIWWVIQKLKIRVKLYSHISKTVSTRLAQQLDSLNICVIERLGKVFISFLQSVKRGSNIRWTAFGVD